MNEKTPTEYKEELCAMVNRCCNMRFIAFAHAFFKALEDKENTPASAATPTEANSQPMNN